MKTYRSVNSIFFSAIVGAAWTIVLLSVAAGCADDDPRKEDTPELITKVTLTFTPANGDPAIIVTASDPDLGGLQDIIVDDEIDLKSQTRYALTIRLINELAKPSEPAYNIAAEVSEEGDEHMFFFGWTGNVFSAPGGNGNIDNRSDEVNYEDTDDNGLPLGLETTWTTSEASTGTFRIILKHQPELKSATSSSDTGETDLDIQFEIKVSD